MFGALRRAFVDLGLVPQLMLYVGFLGTLCLAAYVGITSLSAPILKLALASTHANADKALTRPRSRVTLSQSEWNDRIRSDAFWKDPRTHATWGKPAAKTSTPPSGLTGGVRALPPPPPADDAPPTFKTVCVRTCDGYFFPMSFATTRAHFEHDRQRCERACPGAGKLYYFSSATGSPETMTDLKGEPYAQLPTAFLYQSKYESSCSCRANPWEPAAMARHEDYREAEARRLAQHPLVLNPTMAAVAAPPPEAEAAAVVPATATNTLLSADLPRVETVSAVPAGPAREAAAEPLQPEPVAAIKDVYPKRTASEARSRRAGNGRGLALRPLASGASDWKIAAFRSQ